MPSGVSVLLQEYIPGQPKSFNELDKNEIGSLASALSEVHAIVSDHFSGRAGNEPNCCEGTYEDYAWAMVHESVNVRLNRYDTFAADQDTVPYDKKPILFKSYAKIVVWI